MTEMETLEHLDRALDALMAARIAIGGLPDDLPDTALDEALEADDEYRRVREELSEQVAKLMQVVGPFDRDAVLGLESAVNALVACGVGVGWKLGLLTDGGHPGASGSELTSEAKE